MPPASRPRRAWLRHAAALGAVPLLAARCDAARAAPAAEPLRFGQNAPITGLAQHSGIEYSCGIKLAFEDANARPVVAAYQKRLAATGPAGAEYVSLEGWLAGRVVVEALDRVGTTLTRERFHAAIESLSGLDPGGFALRCNPLRRQYHSGVTLTVLDFNGRPRT